MASLKDIAKATGVSIRTVNRVLKNEPNVALAVRTRVLAAAQELQYSPDLVARSLRTRKSYEIVIIAWSMDELFIAKLAALEQTIRDHGYAMTLMFDITGADNGVNTLSQVLPRRPAGIVLLPAVGDDVTACVATLTSETIPYVVLDCLAPGVNSVRIDRSQGVYESVKYLYSQGRRRIAYLGPPADDSGSQHRLKGYYQALEEIGLEPMHLVTSSAYKTEDQFIEGRAMARNLHAWTPRPDAIQTFADGYALGVLAGLHDAGIRVPDDIAIIGFDDRKSAALSSPPLTTVAQPNWEVGIAAAEMLLQRIQGSQASGEAVVQVLPTRLVIRETA